MASRFVSVGTIDASSGEAVSDAATGPSPAAPNNSEWEAVQRELEAERRRREEARRAEGAPGAERSLFEVLQANKAAKQAAFEEANAIKNQFRPLDDDEIEFLDGVRAGERQREAALRRETEEGVGRFREEQAAAAAVGAGGDRADAGSEETVAKGEEWAVAGGRKRKRREEKGVIRGVKRHGSNVVDGAERQKGKGTSGGDSDGREGADPGTATGGTKVASKPRTSGAAPATAKPPLALVDYGSDDEDD